MNNTEHVEEECGADQARNQGIDVPEPNHDLSPEEFCQYLHRIVATPQPACDSTNYVQLIENYLDESDEHDVNEQDALGRTALHVAVMFRNVDGVAGLLMSGADVNVADLEGRSPFGYCLDSYDMRLDKCNQLFYTFLGHVYKLLQIGLRVTEENQRCYERARARYSFYDKRMKIDYDLELDKMDDVRLDNFTSLRRLLYEGINDIATSSLKRHNLEEIVTSRDFFQEFPKFCCLLKLQYRRSLIRRKLMQPAKAAIEMLAGRGLPDPCTEAIIRHIDYEGDLVNLVGLGE